MSKFKFDPYAPKTGRVRFLFGYAGGGIFSTSYWIARFGFSAGGWSHVMPMLPDGSIIDAYESEIRAPEGGWGAEGFPEVIPAGVRHRPPDYYRGKRMALVEVPVTLAQAQEWEDWLWRRIGAHYDRAAILGFLTGLDLNTRHEWICSEWGAASLRHINVFGPAIPGHEYSPNGLWTALVSPVSLGAVITRAVPLAA